VRVGLVNDVNMALEVLKSFIRKETEFELAWVARDGIEAVEKAAADTPDLILMDLVMPRMDGVEATRKIMAQSPTAILIVTASVDRITSKVFEALGAGALDAVNTPILSGPEAGRDNSLAQKMETIRRLVLAKSGSRKKSSQKPANVRTPLVAIGSSSGGPGALASILSQLPSDFNASICVVQHIDRAFVAGLAEWLDGQTPLNVKLTIEGDELCAGTVYLASTDNHLIWDQSQTFRYVNEPIDSIHRPSVDVFFRSLVRSCTSPCCGVILTGMGSDGAAGLLEMRSKGFLTLAQDKETSSIYGMPKAAAELGAASKIVPLGDFARQLVRWASEATVDRPA
jgi:two-component system, chemotaxis family, response regulator WspF